MAKYSVIGFDLPYRKAVIAHYEAADAPSAARSALAYYARTMPGWRFVAALAGTYTLSGTMEEFARVGTAPQPQAIGARVVDFTVFGFFTTSGETVCTVELAGTALEAMQFTYLRLEASKTVTTVQLVGTVLGNLRPVLTAENLPDSLYAQYLGARLRADA